MIADSVGGASNDLNFPTRGVVPPIEPGCAERREARLIRLRSDLRSLWFIGYTQAERRGS
jgi:hypothetical protein